MIKSPHRCKWIILLWKSAPPTLNYRRTSITTRRKTYQKRLYKRQEALRPLLWLIKWTDRIRKTYWRINCWKSAPSSTRMMMMSKSPTGYEAIYKTINQFLSSKEAIRLYLPRLLCSPRLNWSRTRATHMTTNSSLAAQAIYYTKVVPMQRAINLLRLPRLTNLTRLVKNTGRINLTAKCTKCTQTLSFLRSTTRRNTSRMPRRSHLPFWA